MTKECLAQLAYLRGYRDGLERVEEIIRNGEVAKEPLTAAFAEASLPDPEPMFPMRTHSLRQHKRRR
jgi:hypothetical protein